MRRIIREDDPPKPSSQVDTINAHAHSTVSQRRAGDPRTLSRMLKGELDWLVMKSMEKERNRRYESASDLAEDLDRYLRDEPIIAKPTNRWYRIQKFSRRNRALVASLVAVFVGLSLGATLATNPEQIANSQYARDFASDPEGWAERFTPQGRASFYPSEFQPRYIEAFKQSNFLGMIYLYLDVYPQVPYVPYDVSDKIIHDPVLAIHGVQDPYIHVDGLNGTEQWVDGDLTIVELPQAGHWVHHDAADEVTKLIVDWLAEA